MSQKEKLILKLKSSPKSFTFEDAERLLGYLNFVKSNKGKTSGSRVMFIHSETNIKIWLHVPHPQKELKSYQIKELLNRLQEEGLI